MSEKKGFWASLFGRSTGDCCNMQITENADGCCGGKAPEKPKRKGGCCDMKIIPEEKSGGPCCKQDRHL